MQKLSKIFIPVAIIAGVIGIGALIGWLGGKGSKNPLAAENPASVEPATATASPASRPVTGKAPVDPDKTQASATVEDSAPAPGALTNWEEKLEEILGAETDDTNKVQQLFALFPRTPDESKSEVAQHLSNLTSDADYALLAELLNDGKLPDAALDVLMSDVLNRPNSVKLPELLQVAQTPDHPKAEEAKDILALFLDEDFGTEWSKWQEKMVAWLKDNPD